MSQIQKGGGAKRPVLGRGLSALLPTAGPAPVPQRGVLVVGIDEIHLDQNNPRRSLRREALEELAASIRAQGVLQPVLVRRRGEGGYAVVAGERRTRAAREAGLSEVPVIVKEFSDAEAFEVALVENIQREDLNPIEEAEAYQRLLGEHGLTQEQLGQRVGKDRSTITNALRLLKLPAPLRDRVVAGVLTAGHAKVLLGLDDEARMVRLADQVAERGLSVREVEKLVQKAKAPAEPAPEKERPELPPAIARLVQRASRKLGRKVEVELRPDESGQLLIRFDTKAAAEEILRALVAGAADGSAREE